MLGQEMGEHKKDNGCCLLEERGSDAMLGYVSTVNCYSFDACLDLLSVHARKENKRNESGGLGKEWKSRFSLCACHHLLLEMKHPKYQCIHFCAM